MSQPEILTADAVTAALAELPGAHRAAVGHLQIRLQAPSFPEAVRLVGLVGERAEAMNHHPDVDLRWRTVTFDLATHSAGGLTGLDLELARQILAAGTEVGAQPQPPRPRVEVAIDTVDPAAILPFWRAGTGYREQATESGAVELQHPDGSGPVIWFQPMDPARTGRGRLHVDVYIPAAEAEQRVADAVAAGGRLVTDAHAPDWWVLADAEGNELCVCSTL